MRLLCSVFLIWFSALSTAVHAESKVFAYFCKSADDADSFPILFEQKDGELTLLGDLGAIATLSEAASEVYEFRFVNPAHTGYLRKIEGSWKYLFSDLGIINTADCMDRSDELNAVIELFASNLLTEDKNADLSTQLGERRLATRNKRLQKEIELLKARLSILENRLKYINETTRSSFIDEVANCWSVNVGSRAANVAVTISMSLLPDGKVEASSLHMVDYEGGNQSDANVAFQAGRRAILRCQKDGYDLPKATYDDWRHMTIKFDPSEMRKR